MRNEASRCGILLSGSWRWGIPVGATLQGYYEYCIREGITPQQVRIGQTYYGPSFSNESIRQILINNNNSRNTTDGLVDAGKPKIRRTGDGELFSYKTITNLSKLT